MANEYLPHDPDLQSAVGAQVQRPVGRPVPKRCEPCRATGAVHCSDPENCGGPWDKRFDDADAYMDAPVTESERAVVARKHQQKRRT